MSTSSAPTASSGEGFEEGIKEGVTNLDFKKRVLYRKQYEEDNEKLLLKIAKWNATGKVSYLKPENEDDSDEFKDLRKRFVFRTWPRNPNGVVMKASPPGKEAGNGFPLWGATLFDFYRVHRIPSVPQLSTISSGSKLSAFMRDHGELEWAKDELEWAKHELDPIELSVCDIAKLIEAAEMRVHLKLWGESMSVNKDIDDPMDGEDDEGDYLSIFHPSAYPDPWPLVPFSMPAPKLQKRIPFGLLPKRLIVHDPWNLLNVDTPESPKVFGKWTSKPDRIHTYYLRLSRAAQETIEDEEERRVMQKFANRNHQVNGGTIQLPPIEKAVPGVQTIPMPTYAMLPPKPPQLERVEEAHLYIHPSHSIGVGNHSCVYEAEWEVPRDLLVDDIMCQQCLKDGLDEALKKADAEGSSKKTSTAGKKKAKGKGDFKNRFLDAISVDDKTSTPSTPRVGTVTVLDRDRPPVMLTFAAEDKKGKGKEGDTSKNSEFTYRVKPPVQDRSRIYQGPTRNVIPDVPWQNPRNGPYCSHIKNTTKCPSVPLTAKVRVAAKLSIQGDRHLANESNNYQSFPSHLFQHWNGFNVIPPLHDPVPVGAVVPQFYGYYEPYQDRGDDEYLSPILLLEDCGKPINERNLGIDDKQECASLLYRLHLEGYNHGSFYPRNILMQDGPLTEYPMFRSPSQKSFRLIDFGRSVRRKDNESGFGGNRALEESQAGELFGLGHYEKMTATGRY